MVLSQIIKKMVILGIKEGYNKNGYIGNKRGLQYFEVLLKATISSLTILLEREDSFPVNFENTKITLRIPEYFFFFMMLTFKPFL